MKIIKKLVRISPPPYNSACFGDLRKRIGFTLAEVFIVLTIVGVIAFVVIPPLVESTQKTAEVAALQKFDSEMNQALMKLANDYGCRGDLSCTGLFSTGDSSVAGNAIANYFNVSTICGRDSTSNCFGSSYNYNYDGTGGTLLYMNHVPIIASQQSMGCLF